MKISQKIRRKRRNRRMLIIFMSIIFLAEVMFVVFYSAIILKKKPVVKGKTDPISYNGEVYTYNHNLVNILCLGVDSYDNLNKKAKQSERGQADAIFLVSIDRQTRKVNIISIPRDTMVPMEIYDRDGKIAGVQSRQITLQYAYGTDETDSCKKMTEKVSEMFHDIPIQRYLAANFNAVNVLNDAVGGVTVTMNPEYVDAQLQAISPEFVPGNTVHLMGEMSFCYLHIRDITAYASAADRLERQKTYIYSYLKQAKKEIKKDPKVLFELYKILGENIATDINGAELVSLSTFLNNMNFNKGSMYTLEGTRVAGEKHEEVYVSDEEYMRILTQVFYNKVK